ncbi:MAG: CPBP family intramembrane glutamic endopeptidase, partial [Pseudothermotoga sp.]
MHILSVILILSGMVVLQNISVLFRRARMSFIALSQIAYAFLLSFLLKTPYTLQIQFKGFLYFLLIFAVMVFLGGVLKAEQMRFHRKISFLDFLFIGILLPVSEELTFRGAILFLLPSTIINATIFSSLHLANVLNKMERFSIFNFLYRFAVGYIFAYSVMNTQSLFSPILCHIINNCVGLLALSRSKHETKKGT